MSTYRYTANLILQTIQQNFDDRKTTIDQVNYWIQVVANRLRYLRLNKKNLDTGVYLAIIGDVAIEVSGGKKFITLPDEIIDIDGDGGVDYMSYCNDPNEQCESNLEVQFERIMPSEARTIYSIAVRKPSPSLPFFYRAGKKLYLLGLEHVDIDCVEIGLHTGVNPGSICDLDDEIPIDVSQEEALIARVLTLIRFGLLFNQERTNDGSDTSGDDKNKTAVQQTQLNEQNQQAGQPSE